MKAEITTVLAEHFIMWQERSRLSGPPGEWVCQCGLKFGFSDTAITHVAEQITALLPEPKKAVYRAFMAGATACYDIPAQRVLDAAFARHWARITEVQP